jgi:ferredoxin-type protein NapF
VLRHATRGLALGVAVLLLLPVLPWPWVAVIPPAVSPFVALCGAVAARAVTVVTWLGLPVLVLGLLRRRWFCRFACPVGLLLDGVGRLRPGGRKAPVRLPPVGQWVLLLTLGGALVGYPLLLWLDPMAILAGLFGLWRQPLGSAGMVTALGLPALLVLGWLLPNAWCGRLCPLGATQDLLAALGRLARRVACGSLESEGSRKDPIGRRTVLAMGLGAAWAAAASPRARSGPRPIRPPGAGDEARFASLCVRCGNCVRACPTGILAPDLGGHGVASFLSPVVSFDRAPCRADCHACTTVCPSGAIARLSLEQKQRATMGIAIVDASTCVLSREQDCALCRQACPYDAVRIVFDEIEYLSAVRVDAARCTGCGACQVACFTEPTKAIVVVPV